MYFILFIFFIFISNLEVQAEDLSEESITIPEIEIQSSIGDRTRLTPGSTNYVDRQSIDKSRYLTVGEILQEVPGVVSEIDDGDSRKSNFGIRGAHSRRSRKISVLRQYYSFDSINILLGRQAVCRRRTSSRNQNPRRKIYCVRKLDT